MLPLRAALVQMRAVPDLPTSVELATGLARRAADTAAQIIVLPENHAGIGDAARRRAWAFSPDSPEESPAVEPFLRLSEGGPLIILGGVPERADGINVHNTLLALHDGRVVARYRKLHLFDARLPDGTELGESDHTTPGAAPWVLDTPWACIGLSICYDLRFPELYRALTDAGAEVIVVPAAFTLLTGLAHWDVLIRARAIENQCFVLAAAQWGVHGEGRHSFGHTMVVDPWGVVVAATGDGDGVIVADLDPARLASVRDDLPALRHRRLRGETSVRRASLAGGDE